MAGARGEAHSHGDVPPPLRYTGWALWRRWMLATALGEFAGFAIPSALGPLAVRAFAGVSESARSLSLVAAVALAGLVEGASLGLAQSLVLRHTIPQLPGRRWVMATATAAGLGYILGMVPSTLGDLGVTSIPVLAGAGAVSGALLLALLGLAQWLVLRRFVRRAGWWVLGTALAWLAGLPVPFGGLALVPDGSPLAVWVAAGVASGLVMGIVAGAITGLVLVMLLRPQGSALSGPGAA